MVTGSTSSLPKAVLNHAKHGPAAAPATEGCNNLPVHRELYLALFIRHLNAVQAGLKLVVFHVRPPRHSLKHDANEPTRPHGQILNLRVVEVGELTTICAV